MLEPEEVDVGGAASLLDLLGVSCVAVFAWGVLEVVEEDGVGAFPLLEPVGVSCVLVLP